MHMLLAVRSRKQYNSEMVRHAQLFWWWLAGGSSRQDLEAAAAGAVGVVPTLPLPRLLPQQRLLLLLLEPSLRPRAVMRRAGP